MKTLTHEEFHRQRPGGDYHAYLSYVNTKRAQRSAPTDPYGASPVYTDPQIDRIASREARAQVSPLVKQIAGEIGRESTAEQGHLAGATRNYQSQVSQFAPQMQQAYGGAEQAQAGVNAALSSALTGGGQQLAGELQGKLAAINAPGAQVSQVAGGAAQTGLGAGNAQLGTGSAELSQLLAHGTAAQEYGAKLPGIAAATGLQRSSEIAGKYADQLKTRTGDLQAQLPALIQSLVGSLRSRDEGRRNRNLQTEIAKTSGLVSRTNAQTSRTNAQTSAQRAAETARHNQAQEQRDAAKLGITVAQLREKRREANVKARQTHRGLDQKTRAEKERERHNRQTEKKVKKAGASSTPPWVH